MSNTITTSNNSYTALIKHFIPTALVCVIIESARQVSQYVSGILIVTSQRGEMLLETTTSYMIFMYVSLFFLIMGLTIVGAHIGKAIEEKNNNHLLTIIFTVFIITACFAILYVLYLLVFGNSTISILAPHQAMINAIKINSLIATPYLITESLLLCMAFALIGLNKTWHVALLLLLSHVPLNASIVYFILFSIDWIPPYLCLSIADTITSAVQLVIMVLMLKRTGRLNNAQFEYQQFKVYAKSIIIFGGVFGLFSAVETISYNINIKFAGMRTIDGVTAFATNLKHIGILYATFVGISRASLLFLGKGIGMKDAVTIRRVLVISICTTLITVTVALSILIAMKNTMLSLYGITEGSYGLFKMTSEAFYGSMIICAFASQAVLFAGFLAAFKRNILQNIISSTSQIIGLFVSYYCNVYFISGFAVMSGPIFAVSVYATASVVIFMMVYNNSIEKIINKY